MRICILLLMLFAPPVVGATFVADRDSPLCRRVLNYLNQTKNINRAVQLSGFKVAPFRRAELTFQTADGRQLTEEVEVAQFDIDNNGTLNVVVKHDTWLRGSSGDVLWVFPDGKISDISALPSLKHEEFNQLAAVESMSPWPYAERGVWFANVTALLLDGVAYLSLRDTLLGDRAFPERRWVIAKYSGRAIKSAGYHAFTDDLETICSFGYSRRQPNM